MAQYSTSVILENLEKEKEELEKITSKGPGTKDYEEASYKLFKIGQEIVRTQKRLDESVDSFGVAKRDASIIDYADNIDAMIISKNKLVERKGEIKTKVIQKIYESRIKHIEKKIQEFEKKKGTAENRQRACINKKYVEDCKKRDKVAQKKGKIAYYKELKSDLTKYSTEVNPNTKVGKIVTNVVNNVISYSERRNQNLQSRINKLNTKNSKIKYVSEENHTKHFSSTLATEAQINAMDENMLDYYENHLNTSIRQMESNGDTFDAKSYQLLIKQQKMIENQKNYLNSQVMPANKVK